MNPFGTISKCPTCDKNVYAAEQVIGPGRRMYHKFCLKCASCAKILTPGNFREHDFEPFCQTCHIREFSTQDLRFANVLPPSPTRRARESLMSTPPPPIRVTRLGDEGDAVYEEDEEFGEKDHVHNKLDDAEEPHLLDGTGGKKEHTNRHFEAGDDTQDQLQTTRSPSPTKFTSSSLSSPATGIPIRFSASPFRTYSARTGTMRPISPTVTGMSTVSAPMGYIRTDVTGSPVRQTFTGTSTTSSTGTPGRRHTYTPPGFSGTPSCPRCEKPVYFAEQVKSCGKSWHRLCLRCSECSTTLDPSRVSDKEGVVLCRSCYSKLHGPVGRGYGLVGKIGS